MNTKDYIFKSATHLMCFLYSLVILNGLLLDIHYLQVTKMAPFLTFLFVTVVGVTCSSPPPPVDFDIDRMVGRFYVVRVADRPCLLTALIYKSSHQ